MSRRKKNPEFEIQRDFRNFKMLYYFNIFLLIGMLYKPEPRRCK